MRKRIGEQRTKEWVGERAADKLFRDMLECECKIANLKLEKKELSSRLIK